MAKSINDVGEFRHYGRINGAVVAAKNFDRRQKLATKFFKDKMLILHLIGEASRLEQAFSIPYQGGNRGWGGGQGRDRRDQPLVEEGKITACYRNILDLSCQPIVFGVEDAVDGGEGDIFVASAIPSDVMKVKQFVVVGAGGLHRRCRAHGGVRIGHFRRSRIGVVGDVIQEGMAGTQGADCAYRRQ